MLTHLSPANNELMVFISEPLRSICVRRDAVRSVGGLSPVNKDVIEIVVLNREHWDLNQQIIDICKPLVNIIGNVESRDANLADCMIELLDAYRSVLKLPIQETYDVEFYNHAVRVLMKEFHSINSPLHWFALFLHPLCRNLAISSATHSRTIEDAMRIGLDLASRFGWKEDVARRLAKNIGSYAAGSSPFKGGTADGLDWWKELPVQASECPLKSMGIRILSIVPHAGEVERLFSSLGHIQGARRCNLTVSHMQTLGSLRNYYQGLVDSKNKESGKPTRRKHAHMHTREDGGIDSQKVVDLMKNWTLQSPLTSGNDGGDDDIEIGGLEDITAEELEAEFDRLRLRTSDPQDVTDEQVRPFPGETPPPTAKLHEMYNLEEIDTVQKGIAPQFVREEPTIHDQVERPGSWDPADILRGYQIF